MFNKVLVANRGEISLRIVRTLQKLKIPSVAIYHFVDRQAPFVAAADEAIQIDAESPTAAYLDIEQIVTIARQVGVDAIHPGYGFLAENALFCRAIRGAEITFIGPNEDVIELMGDKLASRDFAQQIGVPVAPSATQTGDADSFITEANKIGYPLLIKAAAGGGGKGMSIVHDHESLAKAVEIARSEAERYFGDGRVYAERFVEQPRHIEVQILGDQKGNVVHLFERECSIQRRFQKIIEETPAVRLPAATREKLLESAVSLASEARYQNAGTVEFILAPDNAFYFLEMNTRLQVEHPITELVTGIDIVEEQLKIASGEALSFSQADIRARGHAIECRICAEVPENDFIPATGTIHRLRLPDGSKVRNDFGAKCGQEIHAAFDSMLGKLIVHADDRDAAIEDMIRALSDFVLLGIDHNIDYLRRILSHPKFVEGDMSTDFVVSHLADLTPDDIDEESRRAILIAAALEIDEFRNTAFGVPEPYASMGQWRN